MVRVTGKGEAFWRAQVATWRRTGLPATRFCERAGISVWSFYHWRRRLDGADARRPERRADPPLLPVRVVGSPAIAPGSGPRWGGEIEVVLRGGRRIRVDGDFDADVLSKVVSVLDGLPC